MRSKLIGKLVGVGVAAAMMTVPATASAGGTDGVLCKVAHVGTLMYSSSAMTSPFATLTFAEDFRVHAFNPNHSLAYGHATSTFPTDGWVYTAYLSGTSTVACG